MRPYILLLYLVFAMPLAAQTDVCKDMPSDKPGQLVVHADPKLNELIYMKKFLSNPDKETEIAGFRIQIFIGNSRNEALQVKNEFSAQYPATEAYMKYETPDFKVRVGDYRNRIEAQKMLHLLKAKYDGAFLVPDKIKFPKL